MKTISKAFKASLPAFFGYISLGMSFGFIAVKAGMAWYQAMLMSTMVLAGAAQFVALSILSAHGNFIAIASATFFINLRHIFYGLSFVNLFPKNWLLKSYMIFGLTDEAYSILTASNEKNSQAFCFYVILFAHCYWILGTVIGSVLGYLVHVDLSFLKFTLTSLFVVLTVEQGLKIKRVTPFVIACICGTLMAVLTPAHMLVCAISLVSLIFILQYTFIGEVA